MRAVLGDTDAQNLIYSDAALDSHIGLRVLAIDDPLIQISGTSFTEELTNAQKARVIFEVCRSVIAHMADEFSYKNPVYSVTRKKIVSNLLRYLDDQLYELQSGSVLIRSENEFAAFLQGPDRFWDAWETAQIPS